MGSTLYQRKFIEYEFRLPRKQGASVNLRNEFPGINPKHDLPWICGYASLKRKEYIGIYRAVAEIVAEEISNKRSSDSRVLILGERFGTSTRAMVPLGENGQLAVLADKGDELGLTVPYMEVPRGIIESPEEAEAHLKDMGLFNIPGNCKIVVRSKEDSFPEVIRDLSSFYRDGEIDVIFAPHLPLSQDDTAGKLMQLRQMLSKRGVIGVFSSSHITVFPDETEEILSQYYFNHPLHEAFWNAFRENMLPMPHPEVDTVRGFTRKGQTREDVESVLKSAGFAPQTYAEAIFEIPPEKIATSCELIAILRFQHTNLPEDVIELLIKNSLTTAQERVKSIDPKTYIERLMIITAGKA
jgi:hypothetical protein